MPKYDFDLFTIGAGSGGVSASRRAGSYGARVAICEERRVGGTCVLRGCVPKKLLVYGAHFREDFEDARGYGWDVPTPSFDWEKLMAAKNRELDRLHGVYLRLLRDTGVKTMEGRATVLDAHTLEVSGARYTASKILIATGSSPFLPDIPGISHAITSEDALNLPALPRRIAIVGGGYIGVEFASIFNALGAQVRLLLRGDTVLRGFDSDVRSVLTLELRKRGIDICPEVLIRGIEKSEDGVSLLTAAGDTFEAEVVLYATGRTPNTRNLGLEQAGVEVDAHGAIKVDEWSQTSVPTIYAVGDCTSRINLTPVAIAEGRAIAEMLFNDNAVEIDHTNVPSAVFASPPVASVGLTEREAHSRFGAIDVYVSTFKPMKHTLSGRDERAMLKLVVDHKSGRVLGCHMVGIDAPEIIQGLAIAIKCGATKAHLDATVGIHPTTAEEFVTMRTRRPDPLEFAEMERGMYGVEH